MNNLYKQHSRQHSHATAKNEYTDHFVEHYTIKFQIPEKPLNRERFKLKTSGKQMSRNNLFPKLIQFNCENKHQQPAIEGTKIMQIS